MVEEFSMIIYYCPSMILLDTKIFEEYLILLLVLLL